MNLHPRSSRSPQPLATASQPARRLTLLAVATVIPILASCASEPSPPPVTPIPDTLAAPTPSPNPTLAPSPTRTRLPDFPSTAPDQSTVEIRFEGYLQRGASQVEIVSPEGTRVLINVRLPAALASPPTTEDILLVTDLLRDSYLPSFAESFPGEKLVVEPGTINRPGVSIVGVASTPWERLGGDNVVYIVETGDLRIAHFGQIEQDSLTPDQSGVVDPVDIAFIPLYSPTLALIDELQPKLVIPLQPEIDLDPVRLAIDKWQAFCGTEDPIVVKPGTLPSETHVLLYGTYFKNLCG